ncbi:hypothetical protein DVW06_11220 [Enterococcus sp. ARL09-542]|uniref:hypothetical protein n=1 Tax=Enterococcus sp. ARL09-542 TaxID=2233534 RepID=UPI0010C1E6CA|nr:hypothetical protein [Enterococcus sp. ARL09-542]TKL05328.1 hypothetical protein DVW06_11220 [Enterococcus sp. ARL09-542]
MKKIGKYLVLTIILVCSTFPLLLIQLLIKDYFVQDAFLYELLKVNWWNLVTVLSSYNLGVLLTLYIAKITSILIFKKDPIGFDQSRFAGVALSVSTIYALMWTLNTEQFMTVTAFISFVALFSILYKRE